MRKLGLIKKETLGLIREDNSVHMMSSQVDSMCQISHDKYDCRECYRSVKISMTVRHFPVSDMVS